MPGGSFDAYTGEWSIGLGAVAFIHYVILGVMVVGEWGAIPRCLQTWQSTYVRQHLLTGWQRQQFAWSLLSHMHQLGKSRCFHRGHGLNLWKACPANLEASLNYQWIRKNRQHCWCLCVSLPSSNEADLKNLWRWQGNYETVPPFLYIHKTTSAQWTRCPWTVAQAVFETFPTEDAQHPQECDNSTPLSRVSVGDSSHTDQAVTTMVDTETCP